MPRIKAQKRSELELFWREHLEGKELGSNILSQDFAQLPSPARCWNTVGIKEPNSEAFVSWHQDRQYIGLDSDAFVTAWLALSSSTVESGCVRILPGKNADNSSCQRI